MTAPSDLDGMMRECRLRVSAALQSVTPGAGCYACNGVGLVEVAREGSMVTVAACAWCDAPRESER